MVAYRIMLQADQPTPDAATLHFLVLDTSSLAGLILGVTAVHNAEPRYVEVQTQRALTPAEQATLEELVQAP